MLRIRASIISLGGGVLAGFLFVLLVLVWIATYAPNDRAWLSGVLAVFCLAMLAYVVDGASESLTLQDRKVVFDGWLTRRREVPLDNLTRVLLVHEGLNTEWGIETLTFTRADGSMTRLALGPLWRRRDLEDFLAHIEERTRQPKIVAEVR